jgi:hypothetical protein
VREKEGDGDEEERRIKCGGVERRRQGIEKGGF